jgi:hypothetical protein
MLKKSATADRPVGRTLGLSSLAVPDDPSGNSIIRLCRFERRWLLRIFETVIPGESNPDLPVGAEQVPLGRFIDDLLEHAPLKFVAGLRACVWMVMLAPPFVLRRSASFLQLKPSERLLLLEQLGASESYLLREVPLLFRTVGCLGFCGLGPVQRRLGINPTDTTPPSWASAAPNGVGARTSQVVERRREEYAR